MPQDIMNEGPGLRQRARETKAVMNTVDPEITKAPPASPPQAVDKIHPKAKFGSNKGEVRLPVDQWMKPTSIVSYKDGTDYVPKTGPAILHEGEKVTPAKDNMASLFDKVPGRKEEKPPKKEIKHIITSKTHDGKYLHKHVHHHPAHEDETHVSNDLAAMKEHMAAHTDGGADSDAAQMTASPSPVAPAGAPAPAAGAPPAPGM